MNTCNKFITLFFTFQYELEIRGKTNINDKRAATKILRAELEQEKRGVKGISFSSLDALSAKEFLLPLELVVEGLRKELNGAVGRDAVNAKKSFEFQINPLFG